MKKAFFVVCIFVLFLLASCNNHKPTASRFILTENNLTITSINNIKLSLVGNARGLFLEMVAKKGLKLDSSWAYIDSLGYTDNVIEEKLNKEKNELLRDLIKSGRKSYVISLSGKRQLEYKFWDIYNSGKDKNLVERELMGFHWDLTFIVNKECDSVIQYEFYPERIIL